MSSTGTASADDGSSSLIGKVVQGRFEVQARIAAGGMGVVYRAIQQPLGRPVAFKILELASRPTDASFQQRFFLEAASAAKLAHPNTIVVFDYGRTEEGLYFIVMEYLEGETLHRRLKKRGPLRPLEAIHVAMQVVSSLSDAHQHGLVHRDLKPGNIMFAPRAGDPLFVKVLDFGLVKIVGDQSENLGLTRTGMVLGSPQYMAPEQVLGKPVDGRTDIYAMGAVLFHMLTGAPVFGAASSLDSMKHQVQTQPPPLRQAYPQCSASPELEQIVMRCLAKSPDDRFASMDELMNALRAVHLREGGVTSGSYLVPHAELLAASQADVASPLRASAPPPSQQNRTVRFDSDAHSLPAPSSPSLSGAASAELSGGYGRSGERSAPSLTVDPMPTGATSRVGSRGARTFAMVAVVGLAIGMVAAIGVGGYLGLAGRATTPAEPRAAATPASVDEAPPSEPAPAPSPAGTAPAAAVGAAPGPGTGADPATEPPAATPEAPAQAPQVVLQSDPPGARVLRGGEELGVTPLPLPIPAGEAWELELQLDGYEEREVRVAGGSPELVLHLTPEPRPVASRPRRRRGRSATSGTSSSGGAAGGGASGPAFGADMNNPWATP